MEHHGRLMLKEFSIRSNELGVPRAAARAGARVLLPSAEANFSGAASSPRPWPADIPLRGYVVTSQKKTETVWRQRGQWSRFPDGVAVDPIPGVFVQPSPTPSPTPAIPIDVGGTGATTYTFSGPYIEFLANGSSNLDPAASPAPAAVIADGFVEADGNFKKKSASLRFIVSVDPLTGAVSVK